MEPMLCMQNCALCWIFELQWWFLISILYLIGFQLLMKKLDMILCISICYIRLVVFILVSCPKFDTILEILVRWTTLLTAFSHCLENISSRTFIMHRLMHSALAWVGRNGYLLVWYICKYAPVQNITLLTFLIYNLLPQKRATTFTTVADSKFSAYLVCSAD